MAEVQPAGIGGRTALTVGVGQHIACTVQLIIQIVQRAQQHTDPVLIQKCNLVGVRELHAGHVVQHPVFFQLCLQCGQSFHLFVRRFQRAGSAVSRIAGGGSRALSGLFCGKAQHFAGGRGAHLAAVQGLEPVRLGGIAGQNFELIREGQPATFRLHGVSRHGFGHLDHHGVGIVPHHTDGFQQRELPFQRSLLFSGIKAEDVFFQLHTQRLQNLAAGITRCFLHHGAVLGLHLDGADLEQHGHGQVNARRNDGQQRDHRHQTPEHPAALDGSPGHLALFALLPPDGVPVLLGRAQALVLVALLRGILCARGLPLFRVLRPLCLLPVLPGRCRPGALGAAARVLAPAALRGALALRARLGGEGNAVVSAGTARRAAGRAVRLEAQRFPVEAVASVGAPGRRPALLRRCCGPLRVPSQVLPQVIDIPVSSAVLRHGAHLLSNVFSRFSACPPGSSGHRRCGPGCHPPTGCGRSGPSLPACRAGPACRKRWPPAFRRSSPFPQ